MKMLYPVPTTSTKISSNTKFETRNGVPKTTLSIGKTLLLSFVFLLAFGAVSAQTYYNRTSQNNVNWSTTTAWSTTSHAGGSCGCTPTAGSTVNIGGGKTVTLNNLLVSVATVNVGDDASASSLIIGNGTATASSLTITGNLTITGSAVAGSTVQVGGTAAGTTNTLSASSISTDALSTFDLGNTGNSNSVVTISNTLTNAGTFQTVGDGGGTFTIAFDGNITNNGTLNLANATEGSTASFIGSGQTISGTGTNTFYNFTMGTTGSNNVNVNSSITINNTLTFSATGLLVVNSSSNVTLGSNAPAISGASSTKYIQLDGTQGSNSQLIRNNAGTTAGWQYKFEIGTSTGGYTPLDMSASTVSTAPTNGSSLAVKAIYTASVTGHLRRSFRMVVTGNSNATTFTGANFYYASPTTPDISTSDVLANYNTIWFLNINTGTWAAVPGTAPGASGFFSGSTTGQMLSTGSYYFTIGAATSYQTWYSYSTGNFSDYSNWTQDPSGTTFVNPFSTPPSDGDVAIILNGFTITADVNNINLYAATINSGATLDMMATTGNSLGTVSGSGLLRVNGVGLPTGTYASFVSSSGGTVEYYNSGGNLSTTQTTYNNLSLTNTTNTAISYVMASNLTVNSAMKITQSSGTGTVAWQINDNTNTSRTLSIAGDLTVSSGGIIKVGTGNSTSTTPHALTLFGNFTNSGVVQFFDSTGTGTQDYNITQYNNGSIYGAALQGNAVNVTFSGGTNATVTCNNHTDFYRFIVSKGTGQQTILILNSAKSNYMRLYGPAALGSSGATAATEKSDNALSIVNGTLEITGTLTIPILDQTGGAANDYFAIPQTAALWINGAGVNVTVASNSAGNGDQRLMLNGLLQVTNGSISFGYSKGLGSGDAGTVNIQGGTMSVYQIRPRAASATQAFSYIQSGGTVNVGTTGTNGTPSLNGVVNTGYGRISIPVATSSFQMSGGILNIGQPTSNSPGGIEIASSTSNYSVTGGTINAYIPSTGSNFTINSTASLYNLNIYRDGTTSALTAQLQASLIVLNNLTLINGNTPTFDCNSKNLAVGGNLIVNTGTVFTSGTNTLTFNGSAAQSWTNSGTVSTLANVSVVVNKSGILTIPNALGSSMLGLTLTSGTLADGGNVLTVLTTLSNSATHTSTGSGAIQFNGTSITGSAGTFGNLTINNNGTVTTSGNQTVNGNLRLLNTNSALNIASNNLTVLGNIFTDAASGVAFSTTKLIITNGNRNDLGLTMKPSASASDLTFPVGAFIPNPSAPPPTILIYTPMTMNITATTLGTVTVRPVASVHPNVTTGSQSVAYYWRVTSSGFAGTTAVINKNYTYSTAVRNGTTTSYVAARYDASTFTWTYGPTATPYNSTTGAGTTTINTVIGANNGWFNTNSGWSANAVYIDGEYTAGNTSAFNGTVVVYYSRLTPGNWSASTTWSTLSVGGSAAASAPCSTCPVVIGDATHNHVITNDANNQTAGSISIAQGSTLNCGSTATGLNFGVYSQRNDGTTPGTLQVGSATFPSGDFNSFLGPSGGTVLYTSGGYTIPTLTLGTYYNLSITPTGAITLPTSNLTIYNNLTTASGTINTDVTTATTRTITVNGNFNLNSGTFSFLTNAGNTAITSLTVVGNSSITGQLQTSGGTVTHTLLTSGSITNTGHIIFANGSSKVDITFFGSNSQSFTTTSPGVTTLDKLTVNLGTSQTPVLTIGGTGTYNFLSTNWLSLLNGTTNFNTSGTVTIENANSFTIPATADLKVSSGTVNICAGNNDTYDLKLNGKLEVAGGTLYVGPSSGGVNNNDIEYASAGTPTIIVSGSGTLFVIGAIRRNLTTLAGALVYNQSGTSTTTVLGTNCSIAANNVRGVFEIESNTGSSFILGGSANLIIQKTTTGSSYADLYLNPVTNSISATSTIQMGLAATTQTMTYNGVGLIGNFTVVGGNTTVTLSSDAMTAAGNVTICSTCVLSPGSLNVNIGGNLVVNSTGTYSGSSNTTTFNGSLAQSASIGANVTFQNVTISNTSNTVTFSGSSPNITNLNILNGTLDVSNLNVTVSGNIINNSTQINTGGGSIALGGTNTAHAITSSGGTFGNLTISTGSATKNVTLSGNLTISGKLTFSPSNSNRYFSIGSNQLTFTSAATASANIVSGTGSTSFIRTNGVTSDLGIVRSWPGSASSDFTYELGTGNNYTPVKLSLAVNSVSGGNITVVAVNSAHPTSKAGEQLLNYYWTLTRDNIISYTATGTQTYSYPSSLMSGAGGTLVACYFDPNAATLGWVPGSPGSATTTQMVFTNNLTTNMPTAGENFDYSAGTGYLIDGTNASLPNPVQPYYSRLTGGNWSNVNSWTTNSSGTGAAVSSPPTGVPVVILPGATITMNTLGRTAYTTQINGTLALGTFTRHNLGIISGTGTLQTATNTFPAGNYNAFVSSTGGTIQYVAPMTMNNRNTYNNLSSTGAGTLTMTSTDLTLNGGLTIGAGVTLDNSVNNKNITLSGGWTNSGGTFSAGTGTVTFANTSAQNITGSTAFNNLSMASSANVTLTGTGPTTVNGILSLSGGSIVSSAGNLLTISSTGSISGGSSASYVSGPMTAVVGSGSTFNFPLGNVTANYYRPATVANTTASDTWSTQYFAQDPTLGGFSHLSLNLANLVKVSQFEYWTISPALATTFADLTLAYNTGSYSGNIGNTSQLFIAHWDNTNSRWDLPPGGGTVSVSGSTTAGTATVTNVTSFSPFTFGSTDLASGLPIELVDFSGEPKPYGVVLSWTTASEVNNDYFTVYHSASGANFESIGTVKGHGTTNATNNYTLTDLKPAIGKNYYQLKQTDFDGKSTSGEVISVTVVNLDPLVKIYPNPVAQQQVLNVEINGLQANIQAEVQIINLQGNKLSGTTVSTDSEGTLIAAVEPRGLTPGLYILLVQGIPYKFIVE